MYKPDLAAMLTVYSPANLTYSCTVVQMQILSRNGLQLCQQCTSTYHGQKTYKIS